MRTLIQDLIPHAPQMGLYVVPHLPPGKVEAAVKDYAHAVAREDVLALYDATLLGNGKDGAIFTGDRVVFQNNGLEPTHEVRYADMVGVECRRKLIGGRRVVLEVNRGRATFELTIDFSGKPDAADYVARFLSEAITVGTTTTAGGPHRQRVREALERLQAEGALSKDDLRAMMDVLGSRSSDVAPDTES